jgi:hypothetical protein
VWRIVRLGVCLERNSGSERPDKFGIVMQERNMVVQERKREMTLGRVVLMGLVLCASLTGPAFGETNQLCVLRCLDHGNLDQTCEARCTTGVPRTNAAEPHRAAPANAPAASMPQSPGADSGAPSGSVPSASQRQQNQAPLQSTVHGSPPRSSIPPATPPPRVNEACVLRCLDHGHLNQYCERICAR